MARVNLDPARPVEERVTDLSNEFYGISRYVPPILLHRALSEALVRVYTGAAAAPSREEFARLCAQAYEHHLQMLMATAGLRQ